MSGESQIWISGIFILGVFYVFFNVLKTRKLLKKRLTFLFLLPSFLVPIVFIIIYAVPLIWLSFDSDFHISFLNEKYLTSTVFFLFACEASILLGHHVGKRKHLRKSKFRRPLRQLDVFLKGKKAHETANLLILVAVVVFPFAFGLRIDLILNTGIRGLVVDNPVLAAIIPFARIILSILSITSGIIYARTNSKRVLLLPFLDSLQHLIKLSRGFVLPLILFLLSYGLSGKKVPSWAYMLIAFLGVLGGGIAVEARGGESEGIRGFIDNTSGTDQNFVEPIKKFFEVNAFVGILSTCFSIRDTYQKNGIIEGLSNWIISILPIPTFLGVTGTRLSVAEILDITHVGIPMPTLGELYYQTGWYSLGILFFYGIFLGNLEGKLIEHVLKCGSSYWPDILIWLSAVFGIFLSIHSPTRSSTRLLIYSVFLVFLCKKVLLKSPYKNSA